ncbi:MAG: ABC transporter permease [Planctomycetes bacterium]|nr:ABC transporter permease [Planctomycetota bacterium]
MNKILGIFFLLVFVTVATALTNDAFLGNFNIENSLRWIGLRGMLSLGVMLCVITGGIDLSIGSSVALLGCLFPMLLVQHALPLGEAIALVAAAAIAIGLAHGLLITKLRLQPFIVTLCGLLIYRGIARYMTDGQTQRFAQHYDALSPLAKSMPITLAQAALGIGVLSLLYLALRWKAHGTRTLARSEVFGRWLGLLLALAATGGGAAVQFLDLPPLARAGMPMPFLLLLGLALLLALFLRATVYGRYIFAIGQNEQAARYSGIATHRWVVLAYVLCALFTAFGAVLFALNMNSVQPATHGAFFELYAIAAAVLGGCSLRGGDGSVLGVLIATAVLQVLKGAIQFVGVPTEAEFAIIGLVILLGVIFDEVVRRIASARTA